MNYFKSVVKNVYERVIQDEYLQNLTQQEVYLILNNTSRKRLLSHVHNPTKLSSKQMEQQLIQKAEQMGKITPQRLFRLLGAQSNIEIVAAKAKQLSDNLQQVSTLMRDNFPKYQKKLNQSISLVHNLKNIQTVKKYSTQLRTKLKRLQDASIKSKRITQLNIKAKNMRMLQKYLSQIPNIKKMTLTQLKTINIDNIKNKSQLANLNCLKGISKFVDHAVAAQLSKVLEKLKLCLIDKFQQVQYENALKDFIIAQHQTIKYQILLIKIIQNQIRHVDLQYKSNLTQICQCYIKFIINLHDVFRWHRVHQKQQKWQNLSKDYYGICIQIDINKITKKITKIMDQCIKDITLQKYYHTDSIAQNLQNLYLICRMSQIIYNFSGQYFNQTIKQITQFLYKKLSKIKQKSLNQLQETLKYQQKNYWNRLPVVDNYSHQPIDRTMYQIYQHKISYHYHKVIDILNISKNMLSKMKMMVGVMDQLVSRSTVESNYWDSVWKVKDLEIIRRDISGITGISKVNITQSVKVPLFSKQHLSTSSTSISFIQNNHKTQTQQIQHQHNHIPQQYYQQSWQIQPTKFPFFQKYQKHKSTIIYSPSTSNYLNKTIICQYSLTILKYIQIFTKYAFYYPIQPILSNCLANISLIIQNYIYQIFNGFLSNNIKGIFYSNLQHLGTIQQKYHKVRFHYQYSNITKFIIQFKNYNKLTLRQQQDSDSNISSASNLASPTTRNSQQNILNGADNAILLKENLMVRSRVVALQSLGYVIGYYQHILKITGFIAQNKQSHSTYKVIQHNIPSLHPKLSTTLISKLTLYNILYSELSQLTYTDCIPKLCNLKNTISLIQSIKWNEDEQTINQYMQLFGKNCIQFYYKMNSNNKGQVPLIICQRLYSVFWRTQLTTIMKTFMATYRPGKYSNNYTASPKHRLQKFIDGLYEIISSVAKDKTYLQTPYQKIKAIFPILMQSNWQNTLQLLKISLLKHQFIYAVCIGLAITSQSCCYLSNQDIEQKKNIIQNWIINNLINCQQDKL